MKTKTLYKSKGGKMENEKLMTVEDAARYFSVKKSTIYKWIDEGKLSCIRLNSRIRFRIEQLRQFVVDNTSTENESK